MRNLTLGGPTARLEKNIFLKMGFTTEIQAQKKFTFYMFSFPFGFR